MNKRQVAAAVAALLALLAASTASAVTFDATNTASDTPGGQRFDQAVGLDYAKQVLADASTFIWNTFDQPSPADRKPVDAVTLVVEDIGGVAFTSANGIHLSAQYVGGYSGDVKTEVNTSHSCHLIITHDGGVSVSKQQTSPCATAPCRSSNRSPACCTTRQRTCGSGTGRARRTAASSRASPTTSG